MYSTVGLSQRCVRQLHATREKTAPIEACDLRQCNRIFSSLSYSSLGLYLPDANTRASFSLLLLLFFVAQ